MIALKQRDDLAQQHWGAIKGYMEKLLGGKELNRLNLAVADLLQSQTDLGNVIMAKPMELERIVTRFNLRAKQENANGKDYRLNYDRIEKTYFLLSSIKKPQFFVKGSPYNSHTIIQGLGLRVCPYCNRNHIGYIEGAKKSIHQLDHYYPKKHYPILALSFYNLIPCCAACNRMKLDEIPKFPNPYDTSIGHHSALKFRVTPLGANFMTKDSEVELKLKVVDVSKQPEMDALMTTFHLEDAYQDHKRDAREALLRHHVYSDDRLKEIARMLFGEKYTPQDLERVRSMTFGAPMDEEEIAHRSLGKLVYDVLERADLNRNKKRKTI